ncbi:hypothetical protein IWQ55_006525 [Labrenzia sp. EL_208]|nr:hypothetical protein [Labrenzia sp. EL_132]MBG6233285.1 hypothetical protein [Labrenzia sp. EL_208]
MFSLFKGCFIAFSLALSGTSAIAAPATVTLTTTVDEGTIGGTAGVFLPLFLSVDFDTTATNIDPSIGTTSKLFAASGGILTVGSDTATFGSQTTIAIADTPLFGGIVIKNISEADFSGTIRGRALQNIDFILEFGPSILNSPDLPLGQVFDTAYPSHTASFTFALSVGTGRVDLQKTPFELRFGGTPSVTPVPLPAALPVLAGGLGFLGFMGWRRKNTA